MPNLRTETVGESTASQPAGTKRKRKAVEASESFTNQPSRRLRSDRTSSPERRAEANPSSGPTASASSPPRKHQSEHVTEIAAKTAGSVAYSRCKLKAAVRKVKTGIAVSTIAWT